MQQDKQFYDHAFDEGGIEYSRDMSELASTYLPTLLPILRRELPERLDTLLEIGAGSGAWGIMLSKALGARKIILADISLNSLNNINVVTDFFGYQPESIEMLQQDMNQTFDLPDENVDVIVFSNSLHHTRDIWGCLSECFRVLKPGGFVVAYPEWICSLLISGWQFRCLLECEEVRAGVSENAYLRDQYLYYLRANGFKAKAIPCIRGLGLKEIGMKVLWFLNNWLFSRYVLIGEKPAACSSVERSERGCMCSVGD